MMNRPLVANILLIFCAGTPSPVQAEQPQPGHDPAIPELAVLEQFVGTWKAHIGQSDQVIDSRRSWALGGRFLKHEFSHAGGQLQGTIYRGYDQRNNRYTLTFLDSQGNVSLLVGEWNQEQKLFHFEAIDRSCHVLQYESYFPSPGTEQWTLTLAGKNPVVVSGVARKQPE